MTSLNEDMDQKSFRKFLEMQSLATISPKPQTAATSNFEYGGNLGRSKVESHVKPFSTKYQFQGVPLSSPNDLYSYNKHSHVRQSSF